MGAGSTVRLPTGLQLPAAVETGAPPTLDLAALDEGHLPVFYLPHASMEQMTDCFAMVEGTRLPLHSQILGAQSAVLRELFLGQREGGCQEPADLSAAFLGASLSATACFLRLLYQPYDAISWPNLAALAGKRLLGEVAVLAHKLDAGDLLSTIAQYLEEAATAASVPELVAVIQLAQHCRVEQLEQQCLDRVNTRLDAAGKRGVVVVDEQTLAGLGSAALTRLLLQSHYGSAYPLRVSDVVIDSGHRSGGFAFAVENFSQRGEERVLSPWVEIGGFEWRLQIYPKGNDVGADTHLSVFLELNVKAAAGNTGVVVPEHTFTLSPGAASLTAQGSTRTFTYTATSWGIAKFAELAELQLGSPYLADDVLHVRVEFTVNERR